MQLWYGGYAFPENGVNVTMEYENVVSAGEQILSQRVSVNAEGSFIDDGQAALDAKARALQAAVNTQFRDLVLKRDDGTATHVALYNNGSISGVRAGNVAFREGRGAEFATYRHFAVTFTAEYPVSGGGVLLTDFREEISFMGGGPRIIFLEALTGPPQRQITFQQTTFKATQSGNATGYLKRPEPPAPLWPAAYKPTESSVRRISGKRRGRGRQDLGIAWNYVFESATPLAGNPNEWV
jgi:hypothetical protein